jgi:small subunit ribosomal protein S9
MAGSKYYYSLGRRKTANASVRLFLGKGENLINGKPLTEAYTLAIDRGEVLKPFRVADMNPEDFHFETKVKGSGLRGQLGAIRHGLSRALIVMNPELKKPLKAAGLLTRDPRMVERKKPGLHKARKAEQYSKR